MGFFSDSLVDPTGLAQAWSGQLKGVAGQPDYGYAQIRQPMVTSAFDAAAKRYSDAIYNRAKNQATEAGWGMRGSSTSKQGPTASRVAKNLREMETDRAIAELGQQGQWMQMMGQQIPSAIQATQKTTPGIFSQLMSPFLGAAAREAAGPIVSAAGSGLKEGFGALRDYFGWGNSGASSIPADTSGTTWENLGQGLDLSGYDAIGATADQAGSFTPDLLDLDWDDLL